jgi:hypothetical protein
MTDKFDGVPTEKDTTVLFRHEVKFGDYDVLYEKWKWDGITAESIVFDNDDIAGLSDDKIKSDAKSSPMVESGSDVTIKRSDTGYTFANFNFKT